MTSNYVQEQEEEEEADSEELGISGDALKPLADDALLRDEASEPADICTAIKGSLQALRKLKPSSTVWKRLMMYTAMVEYDKLRDHLVKARKSKWPYQRASMIVAHRMGKGKSFAR